MTRAGTSGAERGLRREGWRVLVVRFSGTGNAESGGTTIGDGGGRSGAIQVFDPRRRRTPPGGQGPRDGLGRTEDSQNVSPDHLDALVPAPSPVEQLCDQGRIASDVLQAVGDIDRPVAVPADADVL